MIARILAGAALAVIATQTALAAEDPSEAAFRATYKELVETNTAVSNGSCTLAAQRMGAHLKAAGFADDQITYFATPEHPRDGGLVAILPGTSTTEKPILLIAHLDVVEAKRADWTRDPFKLVEENGYFWVIRRQVDGLDLDRQHGPAESKPRQIAPHRQTRADLRRGNQRRVQRRGMAREKQARTDRRRIRAERRRRRPHRWQRRGRWRQSRRDVGAGRRKSVAGLPRRSAER